MFRPVFVSVSRLNVSLSVPKHMKSIILYDDQQTIYSRHMYGYLDISQYHHLCSKESQFTPLLMTQIVVKYVRNLVQCRVYKSLFQSKQLMYVKHIFPLRVFVIKISCPEPADVA